MLVSTPVDGVSLERLMEWAVIEPDPALAYSTRSWGAPITAVKRGLIHVLRQYTGQIVAQESRFNLQLVVFLSQQADHIARLEEEIAGLRGTPFEPPA